MRKFLAGLTLTLLAGASNAQSTISFWVVFDQVYEASGAFAPNLVPVGPGAFCTPPACTIPPVNLAGHVVLTAVASGTALTGTNTLTLYGSFSTQSGNSPSTGWSVHTFNTATFDLFKAGSNFATDFVNGTSLPPYVGGSVNDWPAFLGTAPNGNLSDHGPVALYGGTCPYFFGCVDAQAPAGLAVSPLDGSNIWGNGTQIFNGVSAVYPTLADAGTYPLISGTATQTNPSTGLGFNNGVDAFVFAGVFDTLNTQGFGTSQPYIAGNSHSYVNKVRFLTFSSTGNTAYMVEGHLVNPLVDTDLDTIPDAADNCKSVSNVNQRDTAFNPAGPGDGYGNICDPDFNGDLTVNINDFNRLKARLNIAPVVDVDTDLDGNGAVNINDFNRLKSFLGKPPGPSGLH
jgi:hypothetical protein